jgi:Zn-dependent protease
MPFPEDLSTWLQELVLMIPAILFAVTFHEVAHGWIAERLGDPTARLAGRLTLNPVPHIDPVGALMFILAKFGWAKPVPVNPYNLRHPVRDMVWVAAAGPAANLLLAAASLLVVQLLNPVLRGAELQFLAQPILGILLWTYLLNLHLAAFNLIPIPPLDGSQILKGVLPRNARFQYERLEPYGFILLILFLISGAAPNVLRPIVLVLQFFAGMPARALQGMSSPS